MTRVSTWLRRPSVVAFACGALFAVGLSLSGMTDAGRVIAFLDFTGDWDARLLFVMGGAVGVHFLWLRHGARGDAARDAGCVAGASSPPGAGVDARLLAGAAIFGAGWGMSGYCPGPVLVSLGFLRAEAAAFVAAMLTGMLLFNAWKRRAAGDEAEAPALSTGD